MQNVFQDFLQDSFPVFRCHEIFILEKAFIAAVLRSADFKTDMLMLIPLEPADLEVWFYSIFIRKERDGTSFFVVIPADAVDAFFRKNTEKILYDWKMIPNDRRNGAAFSFSGRRFPFFRRRMHPAAYLAFPVKLIQKFLLMLFYDFHAITDFFRSELTSFPFRSKKRNHGEKPEFHLPILPLHMNMSSLLEIGGIDAKPESVIKPEVRHRRDGFSGSVSVDFHLAPALSRFRDRLS